MKLDEVKRICEAATPGEADAIGWFSERADAELFAMARTMLPKLVKVAEAAKYLPSSEELIDALAALESD